MSDDQLDLFRVARLFPGEVACTSPVRRMVRASDPVTSRLAAEQTLRSAGSMRWRALDALAAAGAGGLTDFELADRTGSQQTSIGKRRGELRDAGLVEMAQAYDVYSAGPAWRPVKRRNEHGALALVWRITAAGCEALATGAAL